MNIKNELKDINAINEAQQLISRIKVSENKAFKMLIDEELVANESFRIYMELSKETINEIKIKAQQIQRRTS